jgi:hypothetical protein
MTHRQTEMEIPLALGVKRLQKQNVPITLAPAITSFLVSNLDMNNVYIGRAEYGLSSKRMPCNLHMYCNGHVETNDSGSAYLMPNIVTLDSEDFVTEGGRMNLLAFNEEVDALGLPVRDAGGKEGVRQVQARHDQTHQQRQVRGHALQQRQGDRLRAKEVCGERRGDAHHLRRPQQWACAFTSLVISIIRHVKEKKKLTR